MAKIGKRFALASKNIDPDKQYTIDEAVALVKKIATAKFDETIECAFNMGLDPKHADQMVRGTKVLPNGTGKETKVIVFAKGDKADEAKKAGADIVGDDDLVQQVKDGLADFDRCIATPDMMGKVGTLGRILGPRGLMPNPKLGTVTTDIKQAVNDAKSGQVEFKVEKNGIIHVGVAKASFSEKAIKENLIALISTIIQAKPSGAKGTYLKRAAISTTMGPGIKLDVTDILAATA